MQSAPALHRERIVWVDNAKAIAMFCIVFGHMMVESYAQSLLYAFHIPTFVFLSGYCFRDSLPFFKFALNKLNKIMVPYAVFGLAAIVFYLIYGHAAHVETLSLPECLLGLVTGSVKCNKMQFNFHLWFLPALFVMSVVFYALKRAADAVSRLLGGRQNAVYIALTVLLFAAVFPFLDWHRKWYLPWGADTALRLLPFYSLGFCVSRFDIRSVSFKNSRGKTAAVLAALVPAAVCFWLAADRNIKLNSTEKRIFLCNYMRDFYGTKHLYIIGALCGIACVVIISVLLPKIKAVVYFGSRTLAVLVMQKFPIMAFRLALERVKISNTLAEFAVMTVLSVAVIVLCLAADKLILRFAPFVYGIKNDKK